MKFIRIFAVCLFFILLFSGCINDEKNDDVQDDEIKGGTLEIEKFDLDFKKERNELWENRGNYYLKFNGSESEIHLFFSNKEINASYDKTYYIIFSDRPKGYSLLKRYSHEEFSGWNLKIEFTETDEKIILHETYRILNQDEVEIKEIISSYREKPIKEINISGYKIPEGQFERRPNFYSSHMEGNQITQKNVDHLFDYLLSRNYTNEKYEKTTYSKSSIGLGLEEEIKEEKYIEFMDGSTFEIHIDSYSGLETGTITMPEGTFMFSG